MLALSSFREEKALDEMKERGAALAEYTAFGKKHEQGLTALPRNWSIYLYNAIKAGEATE